MVQTVVSEQGAQLVGGHSFRVTGAQWLGSVGFSVDRVKTFGRSLSRAALRYFGESNIVDMAGVLRRHRASAMLDVGEDERLTPRTSGPVLCTPDASQSLLDLLQFWEA